MTLASDNSEIALNTFVLLAAIVKFTNVVFLQCHFFCITETW